MTGSQPSCASWTWVRDELLVGHAALALASWPAQFTSVRPGEGGYCARSDQLKLIAETEAGQQPDPSTMKSDNLTSDDIIDGRQNLLRWAGNLTAAKQVAEQWQTARGDKSALPALRLGEIDFLAHLDNDAAAEFGLAARRWAMVDYRDALDFDLAELDRSTALFAAGPRRRGDTGPPGHGYHRDAGLRLRKFVAGGRCKRGPRIRLGLLLRL